MRFIHASEKKMENSEFNKKLFEHLAKDDALQVVLRGHLYVEAFLNMLIAQSLKRPESIRSKFGFGQKVDLAIALGLIDEKWREPLIDLNDLRNDYAHEINLGTEVNKSRAMKMLGKFSAEFQITAAEGWEIIGLTPLDIVRRCIMELIGHLSIAGYVNQHFVNPDQNKIESREK